MSPTKSAPCVPSPDGTLTPSVGTNAPPHEVTTSACAAGVGRPPHSRSASTRAGVRLLEQMPYRKGTSPAVSRWMELLCLMDNMRPPRVIVGPACSIPVLTLSVPRVTVCTALTVIFNALDLGGIINHPLRYQANLVRAPPAWRQLRLRLAAIPTEEEDTPRRGPLQ